jgi:hypothetical protein
MLQLKERNFLLTSKANKYSVKTITKVKIVDKAENMSVRPACGNAMLCNNYVLA